MYICGHIYISSSLMVKMVKNTPANAGGMSLIPDPGRPHMSQINYAPQLLNLCSGARETQPPGPMHPGVCAPQQEEPAMGSAFPLESSPCPPQLKGHAAAEAQYSPNKQRRVEKNRLRKFS